MLYQCALALTFLCLKVTSQCLDVNGWTIAEKAHYIPGPDACTSCVCGKGLPILCKAILCPRLPECQSFSRVGKSCCNFTCVDDLHKREVFGTDLGLRLLVSAVAALISLSLLFFLIHRLRQRKTLGRQSRTLRAERRGLGGIGYLTGGMGYLPENYYSGADGFDRHIEFHYEEAPSHMSLWKPPGGSYLPRGEAPPPYDEVVAHPRPELIITASSTLPNISHRTIPLSLTAPGTIRIIHPQQRRSCQETGVVTLPRTPGKLNDSGSTLHINITGCGFHAVQSLDGTSQAPAPPELADETTSTQALYENAQFFDSASVIPISDISQAKSSIDNLREKAGPSRCVSSLPQHEIDDNDDYRPECENCKSSPSACSKYYPADEKLDPPETMTLQRMPREADDDTYYRSSVTLPIKCKQPRRVLGSRDGWFTTMPESSSEEE